MFDAVCITDPRFMGGTAAAIAADVRAFVGAGLSVALYPVRSRGFFLPEEKPNPIFEQLAQLDGVTWLEGERQVKAGVAFFHHPGPFRFTVANPITVSAVRSVIVTHQPLFDGNGTMAFNPFRVQANIAGQFATGPLWAPISGLCRAQYQSLSPFLNLTKENWSNTFNVDDWVPSRQKLIGPNLVVGRHGRPHPQKWPKTGNAVELSLPSDDKTTIRAMGVDTTYLDKLGVDYSSWDIVPFNGETPQEFLDSLDVFSFFHAPTWIESFGRTVAEAMLMGCRSLLDQNLRATFGPHAYYGRPDDVPAILDRIRRDLSSERELAERAAEYIRTTYATNSIAGRFDRLIEDRGVRKREGQTWAPPLTTVRKLIGAMRRAKLQTSESIKH